MNLVSADKKHIVIVGAGFGGLTATLCLGRRYGHWLATQRYDIILIDRHHHQLFTPALYEIAAIPSEYAEDHSLIHAPLISIHAIIKKTPIKFIRDELVSLDAAQRTVTLRDQGQLKFEYLVLALGSETNFFNIPGLREHAFTLKTSDDAVRLRNKVEDAIRPDTPHLKIIVGGAGTTGVELAAELINFISALQTRDRERALCNVEIMLVEAAPEILPGFDSWITHRAERRLRRLGVKIKTNAAITHVEPPQLLLKDGARESFDILIWTGGVKGPAVLSATALPISAKGTLLVDEYLSLPHTPAIKAIGDNAAFADPRTTLLLPWNIPIAEHEARYIAHELIREILGKSKRPFRSLKKYAFVLAMGKKCAIADLVFIRFSGFVGWLAKIAIELRYFVSILPLPAALKIWKKTVGLYTSND